MITTATEIKHVESHVEVLNSMEVNLDKILLEEFPQEFASDISCSI